MLYNDSQNKLILLLEEIRLALLSGSNIEMAIRFFSEKFPDFEFLKNIAQKMDEGKELSVALSEEKEKSSSKTKEIISAFEAGDFVPDKLDEIIEKKMKNREENFSAVASKINTKLGFLAIAALAPIMIYFVASLSEVFQAVELGDVTISESAKIMAIIVCAIIFAVILLMRRVKNG